MGLNITKATLYLGGNNTTVLTVENVGGKISWDR
jgi:hypothetical protein